MSCAGPRNKVHPEIIDDSPTTMPDDRIIKPIKRRGLCQEDPDQTDRQPSPGPRPNRRPGLCKGEDDVEGQALVIRRKKAKGLCRDETVDSGPSKGTRNGFNLGMLCGGAGREGLCGNREVVQVKTVRPRKLRILAISIPCIGLHVLPGEKCSCFCCSC